jgi:hypothetical protein
MPLVIKEYCIAQAVRAFRLAEGCTDREATARLHELGHQLIEKAIRLGSDPESLPQTWVRRKTMAGESSSHFSDARRRHE